MNVPNGIGTRSIYFTSQESPIVGVASQLGEEKRKKKKRKEKTRENKHTEKDPK